MTSDMPFFLRMLRKVIPFVLCILAFNCSLVMLAAPVTHPNLFLNRAEIEQVKAKIAKYPWTLLEFLFDCGDQLTRLAHGSNEQVFEPAPPPAKLAYKVRVQVSPQGF